jgi:hypothetical protein
VKFPSIAEVAAVLRNLNANVEADGEGCDVRLQVYSDGEWAVRWGDSSYDTDHRGYWGASSIPGVVRGTVKRFDSRDVARDLISQARDARAEDYDSAIGE